MRYDIRSRWTGDTIYTAEIDANDRTPEAVRLGLAARAAVKARADLTGANLTGADLTGAYLTGANLTGANLTRAYLTDAYLTGAILTRAYLTGANLTDAILTRAYLTGANLTDANLAGATWKGRACTKPPIQIGAGLKWTVTITDAHMQIGCEFHALSDWAAFDDARIVQMDRGALKFWCANKDWLLAAARANGRDF